MRPDDAGLVDVASIIHAGPNTRLAGVMTYAGQAYACRSAAEIRVVAGRERDAAVAASKRLNASSLPCPVISVGSTPSCVHASELAGVTEIRPGNFIFFDCMQVAAGVVGLDRIALSVLATVVSSDCRSGRVVVDAGALALSKDGAGADFGYGVAADIEGRPLAGPPHVSRLYQEHGVIEDVTPEMAARIPVGAKLRILPYHACLTAAQFNRYIVVDGDAGVVDFWGKATGSYN